MKRVSSALSSQPRQLFEWFYSTFDRMEEMEWLSYNQIKELPLAFHKRTILLRRPFLKTTVGWALGYRSVKYFRVTYFFRLIVSRI